MGGKPSGAERLILALDVPTPEEARELVRKLRGVVGTFKIGPALALSGGEVLIREIKEGGGAVFLDLKFHDIPSTVERAVRAVGALGVDFTTVHTLGGAEMLRAAVAGRGEGLRLLGVTVLTSHDAEETGSLFGEKDPTRFVGKLAERAVEADLDGVVCSAWELADLRKRLGEEFLLVAPGIRPAGSAKDDQRRTATPSEAVRAGADYLVVGRPILRASEPEAAAQAILEEIAV